MLFQKHFSEDGRHKQKEREEGEEAWRDDEMNSDKRKEKQGNEWIENEGKGWC